MLQPILAWDSCKSTATILKERGCCVKTLLEVKLETKKRWQLPLRMVAGWGRNPGH